MIFSTRPFCTVLTLSLCLGVHSFAASSLGLEALGEDRVMGDAAQMGRGNSGSARPQGGVSYVNPARLALDLKTTFSATMVYEGFYTDGANALGRDQFQIATLTAGFPMGAYGALGFGLWQRNSSEMNAFAIDSVHADTTEIRYSGSLIEIAPSYSLRLPGLLRPVVLGVGYRIPMGHVQRHIKRPADPTQIDSTNAYWLEDLNVQDRVVSEWENKGSYPGYWVGSIQLHSRLWDIYLGAALEHTLKRRIAQSQSVGLIDTTAPSIRYQELHVPIELNSGVYLRLAKEWSVTMDFQSIAWNNAQIPTLGGFGMTDSMQSTETQNFFALGAQKEGSGQFFDTFYKKNSFRAGLWHRDWYLQGLSEWAGTFGMGMPLGKRGAKLDLGLAVGYRTAESFENEWFWNAAISFTGVGDWGKSARRRR